MNDHLMRSPPLCTFKLEESRGNVLELEQWPEPFFGTERYSPLSLERYLSAQAPPSLDSLVLAARQPCIQPLHPGPNHPTGRSAHGTRADLRHENGRRGAGLELVATRLEACRIRRGYRLQNAQWTSILATSCVRMVEAL